nr:hypothetical protein [Janibacter hoylei]
MPGTARRVPSWRKKVLYAAIIGRGIVVVMIVSSMSETMPKVWSGPTTKTAAVVSAARGEAISTSCQPGASPWSVIVRSSSPERSERVRYSRSPMRTVTGSPTAGVVKKLRHPLRSLSAVRSSSHVARASAAAGA